MNTYRDKLCGTCGYFGLFGKQYLNYSLPRFQIAVLPTFLQGNVKLGGLRCCSGWVFFGVQSARTSKV